MDYNDLNDFLRFIIINAEQMELFDMILDLFIYIETTDNVDDEYLIFILNNMIQLYNIKFNKHFKLFIKDNIFFTYLYQIFSIFILNI